MKPVLVVEGKKMNVIAMHLNKGIPYKVEVALDNPMESTTYYDVDWDSPYVERPLRIDLKKHLFDENKLEVVEKINSEIEKLLVKKSEELTELSLEHTHACLKYPFKDDVTKHKFELALSHQMGLMNAQEIVTEYMYDDVDLSGGEQDAEQNQPF